MAMQELNCKIQFKSDQNCCQIGNVNKQQETSRTNRKHKSINSLPASENIYLENFINQNIKKQKLLLLSTSLIKYRNKVIRLIISFHRKLKINKFVLFEAVWLLNSYIIRNGQNNHQILFAVTCLIIGQKKITNKKIKITKWVQLLDLPIQTQQLIELQAKILSDLNYDIEWTTSLEMISIICRFLNLDQLTFMMSRYLLQLSFFLQHDYIGCEFLISICCVQLSCFFFSPNQELKLIPLTLSKDIIKECKENIFQILLKVKNYPYELVYNKYTKSAYQKVALIQFQLCQNQCKTAENSDEDNKITCNQIHEEVIKL